MLQTFVMYWESVGFTHVIVKTSMPCAVLVTLNFLINITTGGSRPPRLLGPATISRKIKIQVLTLKSIRT